jgi:hypothetical protein
MDSRPNPVAEPRRLSIALVLYITLVAAVACAVYRIAPIGKWLFTFDALVIGYAFASLSHIPGIWPLRERMTIVELVIVAFICLFLHGVLMIPLAEIVYGG